MFEESQLELQQFIHSKNLKYILNIGEVVYKNFPTIISKCNKEGEDFPQMNQVVKECIHNQNCCNQLSQPSNNPHSKKCMYLKNEYKLASQLSHPNILSPIGPFFSTNQGCSIIYPQATCDAFQYFLQPDQIPSIYLVKQFIYQITSALSYMHDEKFISHNDFKLENVLVFDFGDQIQFRLSDLGSTCPIKQVEQNSIPIEQIFCRYRTNIYLSYSNQNSIKYSMFQNIKLIEGDIFSLGCAIYIILFRQYPFNNESLESKQMKLKQISQKGISYFNQLPLAVEIEQQEKEKLFYLLQMMLEPLDDKRISAKQILSSQLLLV